MNNDSRVVNSIKNTTNGIISQVISVLANFIVRTIFLMYLNESYLGINGVFTNILTMLSLAELGFGATIIYSMYKPIAENDKEKLKALMLLYKKIYLVIGLLVGIIGVSLIPFLDVFLKDKGDVTSIILIYLLFLFNSVSSYFFAYKRSILSADQKDYINSQYRYVFTIIKSIFQIVIIIFLKSFIGYLLVQIFITLLENIFISMKVDKLYPFLKEKNNKYKLPKEELYRIKKDVKALFITKFGNVMLNGTDNIIISAYVGVKSVGLLSNYTMITGSLVMVLSQLSTGITGSVGNFMAKESENDRYKIFKTVDMINYLIYSFCSICLIILLNPFIELWIGDKYILSEATCIVIAINFLINGVISNWWVFRSTMGLFTQGKYRSLLTALINIIISILLAKRLGLIGVLLGTTISRLLLNSWYDPYIIYKYGLKKDCKEFYKNYIGNIFIFIVILIVNNVIKNIILSNGVNYITFIVLALITLITTLFLFYIVYRRREELKLIVDICNKIIFRIKKQYKYN